MNLKSLLALAALTAIVMPAAYAGDSSVTISVVPGSLDECTADSPCYSPSSVTVAVGTEVVWSNDGESKTVILNGTPDADNADPLFNSDLLDSGDTYSFVFEEVGTYHYFSSIQPWMSGTITVVEKHDMMMGDDTDMSGEAPSATGMMSDGTEVVIYATMPEADSVMVVDVVFVDAEHVNYDLIVTQNGESVLADEGAHVHSMQTRGDGHLTQPLPSSDPVDITVRFNGYGISAPLGGPVGEEVVFTQVVPEFGPIAVMMILGAAITGIIVAGKRSTLIPRV